MKYNLNIDGLKNNFSIFSRLLEDSLDCNIDLSITFHESNNMTRGLIQEFMNQRFLQVDKMLKINLKEYSQIVERDKELEKSLKDHVKQKLSLNNDIEWIIDNNQIITELNCSQIVEEYLNKLFILQTQFKEYVDFLQTQRNVKTICLNQERPLQGYKGNFQSSMYDTYIIYGYKHSDISEIFKKQIVRLELNVRMFHVFTTYYVPKIKPWVEKYYYVYVEVDELEEYMILYGPINLVKEAEEIIMKEFKQLQLYHGIIKSEGLTEEQFTFLEVHEFLKESSYQNYQVSKQSSEILDQLEESLKDIKSMAFQAAIFAEFKDGGLDGSCVLCSNFEIDQNGVEQILESEVEKLASINKNGNCVGYFQIVYGMKLSVNLKSKFNDHLKVVKEEIHNQNYICYLQMQDFSDLQNYEMQFKVKLDSNNEKFFVTGKQDQINKFKENLQNIITSKIDIIDYYQYKNNFNIRAAMIDYQERYDQIIAQNQCEVEANLLNTRIKLSGKQMNVAQLKQDLQQLEQDIQSNKIQKQISIDIPKGINFSYRFLMQLQKYPSIDLVAGACDEVNIAQIYSFRRKQTRIKICNGSPKGLFDIQAELLKLDKALFIIPIEKVHLELQKPSLLWEHELIQQRQIDTKQIKETKFYKLNTYSTEITQTNANVNSKDKKKKPKTETIDLLQKLPKTRKLYTLF
ncbi:unnamed protein product (macronuclear) [Paramecium tetraurelia]|uniref:Uncharacterized protein n=1 Tax=Paramecium tetraurelia TaxID=5888 RepID=A0E3B0_PARTE|nr:uncharacterized protein GSPATT00022950001 [Paramecium tetraurelia]CAK89777.1 unnamed protein product [Paramecium tetraurelia]|eukprot:XP_001457174.1 hypothetical protein (macronuclear) [Paramecium tetraurelia strain d4-2]